MKIETKTELSVEDFADALANAGDDEQGEFFNVFFKSLELACGSEYKTEMQLAHIESKLSERSQNRLKFFYDGDK